MQVNLSLAWPFVDDERQESKEQALIDIGLCTQESLDESTDVILHLDASEPVLAAQMVVDALSIMSASDLQLCFWPPGNVSVDEARHALRLLGACTRRRALLSARRELILASDNDDAKGADNLGKGASLNSILAEVQAQVDAFCSSPPSGVSATSTLGYVPPNSDTGTCEHPSSSSTCWIHPSLRVRNMALSGRGLFATLPLKSGEDVLRCPEDALLNVFTAMKSKHFGATARHLLDQGLHSDTVAMLFAIAERRRCGGNSGAAPWAEVLASSPSVEEAPQLMAWPVEAIQALGSAQVAKLVEENLSELWRLSAEVKQKFAALPKDCMASLCGPIGLDDLLWARCFFDSRAVAVTMEAPLCFRATGRHVNPPPEEEDGYQWILLRDPASENAGGTWQRCPRAVSSLAPGVELLNHEANGVCASPAFDESSRSLVVATVAGVPKDRELCLCYGPLQNFELLLYYGFCLQDNPHDRLTISTDAPSDEDGSTKEVLMRLNGIPSEHVLLPGISAAEDSTKRDGKQSLSWASIGCLPPQMFRCLRLLLAEAPESVEFDLAPGAPEVSDEMKALDLQCLDVLEDLLASLAEPFTEPLVDEPLPLWWLEYGEAVSAFRASQRALISANCSALDALRSKLQQVR